MSLTNPKTVVTEERLSAFYQKLLPYLGGIPDLLANKFSKGDLYSTDEQMVGQWIDGKPLYQRTYQTTMGTSAEGSIANKTINLDSSTKVVDLKCVIKRDDGHCQPVFCQGLGSNGWSEGSILASTAYVSGNIIYIQTNQTGLKGLPCFVTIKYTKTTDSAIAIGSDTDYSTEEKIIGTWINGKPIYQKTVAVRTGNCTTDGTLVQTEFPFTTDEVDWSSVISTNYQTTFISNLMATPIQSGSTVTGYRLLGVRIVASPSTKLIVVQCSISAFANTDFYVTVHYTKTS